MYQAQTKFTIKQVIPSSPGTLIWMYYEGLKEESRIQNHNMNFWALVSLQDRLTGETLDILSPMASDIESACLFPIDRYHPQLVGVTDPSGVWVCQGEAYDSYIQHQIDTGTIIRIDDVNQWIADGNEFEETTKKGGVHLCLQN